MGEPIAVTLQSDADLFAAALLQLSVQVWSRTADDIYVLLEMDGIVRSYDQEQVLLNGTLFDRSECEFRLPKDTPK